MKSERTPYPEARNGSLSQVNDSFCVFGNRSDQRQIVAADVWSCLEHIVQDRLKKSQKERLRAVDHIWQGFEFFEAAKNPRFDSRPLLYYYSFLNVTKAFLLARGVPIPSRAHHGVKDPVSNDRKSLRLEGQQITVVPADKGRHQLLAELIKTLDGKPHAKPKRRLVLDLMAQVPAIHTAYLTIGRGRSVIPTRPLRGKRLKSEQWYKGSCFARVEDLAILSDANGLWANLTLDARRTDAKRVSSILATQSNSNRAFRQVASNTADQYWFETEPERLSAGLEAALERLSVVLRKRLWAVLTPQGYRYCLGAIPSGYAMPQLASIYAAMFYLGSVTRYRPDDYDKILGGRYAWLVEEFVATQPSLFMYLLTSLLAGQEVVPESSFNVQDSS